MIKDENTPLVGGQPLCDVVIETGGKQLESKTACGKTSPNKPSLFKVRREVRARRQGKAKKKQLPPSAMSRFLASHGDLLSFEILTQYVSLSLQVHFCYICYFVSSLCFTESAEFL